MKEMSKELITEFFQLLDDYRKKHDLEYQHLRAMWRQVESANDWASVEQELAGMKKLEEQMKEMKDGKGA